jgi:hypothetical protein
VTIYYRWHPLFGRSLRVCRREKKRRGEYIFYQLPDGTICSLPAWMFSPAECAQFSLGSPLIAAEALVQLRDVLDALQVPSGCDKASLKPFPKGGSK